jgi:Glycosyl hydrolases family 16
MKELIFVLLLSIFIAFESAAQNSDTTQRTLMFNNKQWIIKTCDSPMGPGSNLFGLHKKNVYINKNGDLILSIQAIEKQWSCAEIISAEAVKEGIYEITINSNIANLEPNIVFGFFLYNELNPPFYDEIDIEFSTWNRANNFNTQYTIHQSDNTKKKAFTILSNVVKSNHSIALTKDSIFVKSNWLLPNSKLQTIEYSTPRPPTMNLNAAHLRLNLWINKSDQAPKKTIKIKIANISFTPIHLPTN